MLSPLSLPDARTPFGRRAPHAQAHFVGPTREVEVVAVVSAPRELAAAGPLPYREQAEILTILRPVLPESYATATGKIILACVMGERPELEPGETPLYAATFLAEKGHKPKTVSRFQSSFGARESNRYLKVHGRWPEKIPGPAGSRIEKVAVHSEEDRPLLELVYSELALRGNRADLGVEGSDPLAGGHHGGRAALAAARGDRAASAAGVGAEGVPVVEVVVIQACRDVGVAEDVPDDELGVAVLGLGGARGEAALDRCDHRRPETARRLPNSG